MIQRLQNTLHWFTKRLRGLLASRIRVIMDRDNNQPYLIRYYLFLKDRGNFPFNVVLHKILKSDQDDLHDHPWPWISIILKGGYWEHMIRKKRPQWRGFGSISFRSSRTLHRIELRRDVEDKELPCWTLFVMGPKGRVWGFVKDGTWIENETYLTNRQRRQVVQHISSTD